MHTASEQVEAASLGVRGDVDCAHVGLPGVSALAGTPDSPPGSSGALALNIQRLGVAETGVLACGSSRYTTAHMEDRGQPEGMTGRPRRGADR